MLDGVTVLDLASVGPAARASRWLADYGARVVKIGPVPDQQGVQIVPPFYAYSAHRSMHRALFNLRSTEGRDAFLRLADDADVVIESFRPGVVDRLGVGWEAVSARNPRAIYCSTTGFGQHGPHAHWAGHDLNYLAVGGYLDCTGPGPDGGPPIPGATIADSAAFTWRVSSSTTSSPACVRPACSHCDSGPASRPIRVTTRPSWPRNRISVSGSLATLASRTIRPVPSTTHTLLCSSDTSIPA